MTISVVIGSAAGAVVLLLGIRGSARLLPARRGPERGTAVRRPGPRRRSPTGPPSDLDVAAWCDGMARSVRSGSSITSAVRGSVAEYPRLTPLVEPIARQITRGRSLGAALRAAPAEPSSAVGLAMAVLRSCADLGGPAASPLERVAATLRDRDAIRQEQLSHSAQARMSARVMTLVPVGMLALLAATDAKVRGAVGTPAGLAAVTAGAALNVCGWWWMQRIIGRPR